MTELVSGRPEQQDAPAGDDPPATTPPAAHGRGARRRQRVMFFVRRPGLALSILVVAVVLGWALFPDAFTSHDPLAGVPRDKLHPPGRQYWFGTDNLGRDVYSRVVHGSALSLKATAIAVTIAFFLGSAIGLVSGFVGGRTDDLLMRLVDVLMSIPGLLLSLAVVTALGFGTVNVAIAVGIASLANFARVMRSDVFRAGTETFVEAAVAAGVRRPSILRQHVLPHAIGSVIVLAALEFGTAILAVSSLSFLGYGASPPQPEWGSLVSDGSRFLDSAWWLTTLPGLVVIATVLAANRISRALGDERSR
ncbi:ABC transporter permease [Frankia sp. QA3]|uniref:ABC transporter permease n=1 Tax=Frankia sp. QA3 TaxID=710111 RepID=UPI000269BF6F|nr:ABC transporter permease [Frankia sp. QA3]EIV92444.1 ABC-type dipeptide/oligopeptide/nickel transport system, permease component [Frankia sp. QA3]